MRNLNIKAAFILGALCMFVAGAYAQTPQLFTPNGGVNGSTSSAGVGIGTSTPGAALGIKPGAALTFPAVSIDASDANNAYTLDIEGLAGGASHVQLSTNSDNSRLSLKCAGSTDKAPRLQMTSPNDVSANKAWAIFDYGSREVFLPDAKFKMRWMPGNASDPAVDVIQADGTTGVYIAPTYGKVAIGHDAPMATLDVMGKDTTAAYVTFDVEDNNSIGLDVAYDGAQSGSADMTAIYGTADGGDDGSVGYGQGGVFWGGWTGVVGVGLYSGGYGGQFQGDVDVTGDLDVTGTVTSGSDRKLKRNISDLTGTMNSIMQLKPSTYDYRTDEYPQLNLSDEHQFGLIAQDLQQVFPNLVKENVAYENGDKSKATEYLSVNYISLVPVLIAGMQEQQAMISAQQERIEALEAALNVNNDNARVQSLGQSMPNPATSTVAIPYQLENASNAQIVVRNIETGAIVRTVDVEANGFGKVNFDVSNMADGVYSYSLVVNGEVTDTKKMVVTK